MSLDQVSVDLIGLSNLRVNCQPGRDTNLNVMPAEATWQQESFGRNFAETRPGGINGWEMSVS
jgi:hypothetical protein